MALSDELHEALRFHLPHVGPSPDPASLLQFFVDSEQPPAAQRQAFSAFLQYAAEVSQSQLNFVQALQKSVGQGE